MEKEIIMAVKPTKPDTILKLISRKSGATLAQLVTATGWKPHSVRAALTGLRKKGVEIERLKNGSDVTFYKAAGV